MPDLSLTPISAASLTVSPIASVYSSVVNAKTDFGAKGDNSTDDTNAIQSAIEQVEADGGGIVFIPEGTYRITEALVITGAAQTDSFDAGGVSIVGASQRGTKLKGVGGITVLHFGDSTKMMCHLRDLELSGPGEATASSRGVYWENPGGNYQFENVYVHDFATGMEWYDSTLGTLVNCAIRKCTNGIKTGYNHDIWSAIGCRFDYCDTAIYIGQTDAVHTTRAQDTNCIQFIGCRISNNDVRGIFVNDTTGSGILFRGCYFESNPKEAELGVSGEAGNTSFGVTFDGCFFTPVTTAPVAEGISIYNDGIVTFRDCKTDSTSGRYTVFCKAYKEATRIVWESNAVYGDTATVLHGGLAYSPATDSLVVTSKQTFKRNGGDPSLSDAWFQKQMTGGTGKTWESWTRRNSSTDAVLGEFVIKDSGGVLRAEGLTAAFITATNLSALPTATANHRGSLALVTGGAGVADTFHVCIKNAADSYEWKTVTIS